MCNITSQRTPAYIHLRKISNENGTTKFADTSYIYRVFAVFDHKFQVMIMQRSEELEEELEKPFWHYSIAGFIGSHFICA